MLVFSFPMHLINSLGSVRFINRHHLLHQIGGRNAISLKYPVFVAFGENCARSFLHRADRLVVPDAAPGKGICQKLVHLIKIKEAKKPPHLSSMKTKTTWRKARARMTELPMVWNQAWTGFSTSSNGGLENGELGLA